jgi:hypothetical protein
VTTNFGRGHICSTWREIWCLNPRSWRKVTLHRFTSHVLTIHGTSTSCHQVPPHRSVVTSVGAGTASRTVTEVCGHSAPVRGHSLLGVWAGFRVRWGPARRSPLGGRPQECRGAGKVVWKPRGGGCGTKSIPEADCGSHKCKLARSRMRTFFSEIRCVCVPLEVYTCMHFPQAWLAYQNNSNNS